MLELCKKLTHCSKKECVSAYLDGKRGKFSHYIFSVSVDIGPIIITFFFGILLLTGKPFWFNYIPKEYYYPLISISTAFIVIIIIYLSTVYFLYRKTFSNIIESRYLLHKLMHDIRDSHIDLLTSINKKGQKKADFFKNHFKSTNEDIRELFRSITNDETVASAIRIAVPSETEPGNVLYRTMARTLPLSPGRERTSEDIPANIGVPRYLIENEKRKVLIYSNIKEAIKQEVFKQTQSEIDFPDDVKTMMVAPLNGWDNETRSKQTIGILYVTSKNKNIFHRDHIDMMRSVADIVSDSFSLVTFLLEKSTNKSNGQRGLS